MTSPWALHVTNFQEVPAKVPTGQIIRLIVILTVRICAPHAYSIAANLNWSQVCQFLACDFDWWDVLFTAGSLLAESTSYEKVEILPKYVISRHPTQPYWLDSATFSPKSVHRLRLKCLIVNQALGSTISASWRAWAGRHRYQHFGSLSGLVNRSTV